MTYPYYTGKPRNRRIGAPAILPGSRRARQTDPAGYLPDPGLVDAVNVALLLGQPLLLTGEPGTGKTQLAYNLAWELEFPEPLSFETKSTSTSRELFYTYDAVGHFRAIQMRDNNTDATNYITWNALGEAILRSCQGAEIRKWLSPDGVGLEPQRSVVLIDEIDKAPRDFPNDILNEVEALFFRIPELNN